MVFCRRDIILCRSLKEEWLKASPIFSKNRLGQDRIVIPSRPVQPHSTGQDQSRWKLKYQMKVNFWWPLMKILSFLLHRWTDENLADGPWWSASGVQSSIPQSMSVTCLGPSTRQVGVCKLWLMVVYRQSYADYGIYEGYISVVVEILVCFSSLRCPFKLVSCRATRNDIQKEVLHGEFIHLKHYRMLMSPYCDIVL